MEGKPVVGPVDIKYLTKDTKREAFEVIHLIQVKSDGIIKGGTRANSTKQHMLLTGRSDIFSKSFK